MPLGDRLGIAGLIMGALGVSCAILWPTRRWIGWLFLGIAAALCVSWGAMELEKRDPADSAATSARVAPISALPSPVEYRAAPPKASPSSAPYPWLRFSTTVRDNDLVTADIGIGVRDYPSKGTDSTFGSLSSLFNLSEGIYALIGVDPSEERWYECILSNDTFPEWNNSSHFGKEVSITFSGSPRAVLEYSVNTRNGRWRGIVSMQTHEGSIETDQSIVGTVLLDGKQTKMSRTEEVRAEKLITANNQAVEFAKKHISQLGVPTRRWTADELRARCPGGYTVGGTATSSPNGRLDVPMTGK
jgi:hypothetical protein